jgi:hypothetical protein
LRWSAVLVDFRRGRSICDRTGNSSVLFGVSPASTVESSLPSWQSVRPVDRSRGDRNAKIRRHCRKSRRCNTSARHRSVLCLRLHGKRRGGRSGLGIQDDVRGNRGCVFRRVGCFDRRMVSKVELTITLLADWTAWACCFLSVLARQQNGRRCSFDRRRVRAAMGIRHATFVVR